MMLVRTSVALLTFPSSVSAASAFAGRARLAFLFSSVTSLLAARLTIVAVGTRASSDRLRCDYLSVRAAFGLTGCDTSK